MQFNRDESGVMQPLPRPSVDTGMGLERITAVLQQVHSNYEIDLFVALIAAAKQAVDAAGGGDCDVQAPSLKVIADHIRACAFTVADGVMPDRAGRGYVLRRICRRAIRHGYKLGARQPFFYGLIEALVQQMGEAYPELGQQRQRIEEVIKQEEEAFFRTIEHGMHMLESALSALGSRTLLEGETAFKLHDTYGFPVDLTADICRERGLMVDVVRFDACLAEQRQKAREAEKFGQVKGLVYGGVESAFHGYDQLSHTQCQVTGLYVDGTAVSKVRVGDHAVIVLNHTPFYAESGGQVGDAGELRSTTAWAQVEDVFKIQAKVFGHFAHMVEGELKLGDFLSAHVDAQRRARIVRNHSATHLMHQALREVLGEHVQQKGSLVTPERTRFDFAHNAALTPEQKSQVEVRVNAEILANVATEARVMAIEDAQKLGAMMLFGEKYGDEVRVLDIGSSRELCGGTHVRRTGDIGLFKIVTEGGVAAGVRRVEAVTGDNALSYLQQIEATLHQAAANLRATPTEVNQRLCQLLESQRALERECDALRGRVASSQGDGLIAQAVDIQGVKVLAVKVNGADAKVLRDTLDQLKSKLKTAVIVLASIDAGKVQLAAGVTPDCMAQVKAGELVNFVAQQVGGKGGGKPDMAMAGGTDAAALPQALSSVAQWVRSRLG